MAAPMGSGRFCAGEWSAESSEASARSLPAARRKRSGRRRDGERPGWSGVGIVHLGETRKGAERHSEFIGGVGLGTMVRWEGRYVGPLRAGEARVDERTLRNQRGRAEARIGGEPAILLDLLCADCRSA